MPPKNLRQAVDLFWQAWVMRSANFLSAMFGNSVFWTGFRDQLSFLRLRLQTHEVITPGETRGDAGRTEWTEERAGIFQSTADTLDLPVQTSIQNGRVILRNGTTAGTLFSSWPDAFGPCQTEFNHLDANQTLLWGARLAETWEKKPANVRAYLTGFDIEALQDFQTIKDKIQLVYRLSLHGPINELPEILEVISPRGRLYTTLWEFKTDEIFPNLSDAWMVIGVVGTSEGYRLEIRLNKAPLPENEMSDWLNTLFSCPLLYAPLPAFIE